MEKRVIVMTGKPEVGKDTFIDLYPGSKMRYSVIDPIKNVLSYIIDVHDKTKDNSSLMSDVKVYLDRKCYFTLKAISKQIEIFKNSDDIKVLFITAREEKDILIIKNICYCNELNCKTIKVVNTIINDEVYGNMADDTDIYKDNVDFVYINDKSGEVSMDEFKSNVICLIDQLCSEKEDDE
jgi:hypothetical protein